MITSSSNPLFLFPYYIQMVTGLHGLHASIYSTHVSWVLTLGLQCPSPTCPLGFLPTRPSPLSWEDPPVHPPPSDSSPASFEAYQPLASYSSDHIASPQWSLGFVPLPAKLSVPKLWACSATPRDRLISWCIPTTAPSSHTRGSFHGLSPSLGKHTCSYYQVYFNFNVPFQFFFNCSPKILNHLLVQILKH